MIDQLREEPLSFARPRVLILGASTRSAAFSALRAGFDPVCIDQFGDADLRANAEVHTVDSFSFKTGDHSHPVLDIVRDQRELPILYAGGMENQLSLIELLETDRTIWGASRSAIEWVRDPQRLAATLTEVRQRVLPVQLASPPPVRDGSWIVKPIASAGGRGIALWDEKYVGTPDGSSYFQQRVTGRVYSAVFLADTEPGDIRFVGLTRQLIGCPELHASPFAWCGNIGPVFLPVEVEFLVRRWGNILKWKFGLTGLYGVDFMVDDAGQPWLLEVNPRLTGAVEVLELACGLSLVADHIACYDNDAAAFAREFASPPVSGNRERLGRAILYAPRRLKSQIPLPECVAWETAPLMADIPEYGSMIETGRPVCSVYAWGEDESDVTTKLFEAANRIQPMLTPMD
jgi:predicted ATP-grasp superfamily ATP-dependent carboligase